MEKKKIHSLSLVSLIVSVLPFTTLIPVLLKVVLPDGVRMVWSIANIACVIAGMCLSVICVKDSEKRNVISIISTIISCFMFLLVGGIAALALILSIA